MCVIMRFLIKSNDKVINIRNTKLSFGESLNDKLLFLSNIQCNSLLILFSGSSLTISSEFSFANEL